MTQQIVNLIGLVMRYQKLQAWARAKAALAELSDMQRIAPGVHTAISREQAKALDVAIAAFIQEIEGRNLEK